eukprot:3469653-Pleurochrysis_carterae.AAC.3
MCCWLISYICPTEEDVEKRSAANPFVRATPMIRDYTPPEPDGGAHVDDSAYSGARDCHVFTCTHQVTTPSPALLTLQRRVSAMACLAVSDPSLHAPSQPSFSRRGSASYAALANVSWADYTHLATAFTSTCSAAQCAPSRHSPH